MNLLELEAVAHIQHQLKTNDTKMPKKIMAVLKNSSYFNFCGPLPNVLWRLRNPFWRHSSRCLSGLKFQSTALFALSFLKRERCPQINFRFRWSSKRSLFFDKGADFEKIRNIAGEIYSDLDFMAVIKPVCDVKSRHHDTLENCLARNIISKYLKNDQVLAKKYLKSGCGGC